MRSVQERRGERGLALLGMLAIVMILSAAMVVGLRMSAQKSKRVATVDARAQLEAVASELASWAVRNQALPDDRNALVNALSREISNRVHYYPAPRLLASQNPDICQIRRSDLVLDAVADQAFVLVHAGRNGQLDIDAGQWDGVSLDTIETSGNDDDLVLARSLSDLQERMNCYRESMYILNNELPLGYPDRLYSARIYVRGGDPHYRWGLSGQLPGTVDTTEISGCVQEDGCLSISGDPGGQQGTYNLRVDVRDTHGDRASKSFKLIIGEPRSGAEGSIDIADMLDWQPASEGNADLVKLDQDAQTIALGSLDTADLTGGAAANGCLWSADTYELSGRILRGFYEFEIQRQTESVGGGFSFALMSAVRDTSECGEAGEYLGYGGNSAPLPGNALALAHDLSSQEDMGDPGEAQAQSISILGVDERENGSSSVASAKRGDAEANPECSVDELSCLWKESAHSGVIVDSAHVSGVFLTLAETSEHRFRFEVDANFEDEHCLVRVPEDSAEYAQVRGYYPCTGDTCEDLSGDLEFLLTDLEGIDRVERCLPLVVRDSIESLHAVRTGLTLGLLDNGLFEVTISQANLEFYRP